MFIMLQVRPRSLFSFIFVVFHNQRVKKENLTLFVYITTRMLTGGYFFCCCDRFHDSGFNIKFA